MFFQVPYPPKWAFFAYAWIVSLLTWWDHPSDSFYNTEVLLEQYDFIVVGGGSAGNVVANRLSAIPEVQVLLVEAGGAPTAGTEVPSFFFLHNGYPYDWNYKTVPQKDACLGLEENRSKWTRGKALGGTSVVNAMVYVRGNKRDYDQWAENGAAGWSYEDVLPYFKSIEKFNIPEYAANGYHGNEGELSIGHSSMHSLSSDAFLEGCRQLGYEYVDYNGPSQTGCSRSQFNLHDGRRVSSAKAFILPVLKQRANLHVALNSVATKIQFENQRAVGVHFEKDGISHYIRASREVILSAGAIGSPQLLMLSGVGPRDHLRQHKIEVIADLPVGQNLQDHIFIGGITATIEKEASLQTRTLSALVDYLLHGTGPMSVPAGIEAVAFMSTPFVNESLDFPDVELIYVGGSYASEESETFLRDLGYKKEVYDKYLLPHRGKPAFEIQPVLNRLKSIGHITLKSDNPHDHPLLDPKYFSHPEDIKVAVEAAKLALKVIDSKAMKALGAKRWNIALPGCEDKVLWSDEYLECLARHLTHTTWHFCCTCAMGANDSAVVDPRLRVRGGIRNLRVIDASIMPYIVSANLNAPAHMIGAKGADMILEDHGFPAAIKTASLQESGVGGAPLLWIQDFLSDRFLFVRTSEGDTDPHPLRSCVNNNRFYRKIPMIFQLPEAPKWALFAFAYMLSLLCGWTPPSSSYFNTDNLHDAYDFIVVGGGSAGSIVANRLSANPDFKVLLIEAGGAPSAGTEIPSYFGLHNDCPFEWQFKTVPQKNACLALEGQRSKWTRGKVLGGTSVINSMMYVRGNRRDYDQWAENGATGWSYEEVLPYFKSIETFQIPDYATNGYHGDRGELPITYSAMHSLSSDAFLKGCSELGYSYVDYNGPSQTGHSRVQFNIQNGLRVNAAKAFIQPIIKERPNLHIVLDGVATKIEFKDKHAVGVHFEKNGAKHYVRAEKEVILSAGSIGSPHLLMLSGVGPKEHLQEHKIKVVADLPVGQNLQDHIFVGGIAGTMEEGATLPPRSLSSFLSYLLHGNGPMAIPGGIEALAFMSTSFVNASLDFPDVELIYIASSLASSSSESYLRDMGLKQEVFNKYFLPKRGETSFYIGTLLNRLKSTGEIRLNSTDPHDHPLLDPKYYSHPEDIQVAVESAKKALAVMDTKAMKSVGTKRWNIPLPGCEDKELWSDAYLDCLARHLTFTSWHFCCTCAMGEDKSSVVDPRLRVRGGLKNLRVIDASIMPFIVTGNLNAPAHMIGAKGAAMILEDHGFSHKKFEV
ncbi:uncharacterized protein LOC135369776 [Ornithodoros turicata]|uniref:uncharacterized protein LOC135369776 n=1 Tax=Ornithodoros turicata TaxID=34597 RepID=UPI00313871B8